MEPEVRLWIVRIYESKSSGSIKYTAMSRTHNGALELAEGLHLDNNAISDIRKIIVTRLDKHVVSDS